MRDRDEERRSRVESGPGSPDAAGTQVDDRWAVILAGGEGSRLLPLTRQLAGDERPKQFCSLLGRGTLLDDTRRRVAHAVHASRTLYVLTRSHERFYQPLVADVPRRQLVEQPANVGTTAAVLYALLRRWRESPSGTMAFFPSDHYVSDDAAFMRHVERALVLARRRPELVVLIGIPAESPETEYGWIEPAPTAAAERADGFRWIDRFWEKPDPAHARALMSRGCVWNSFVMVGSVAAFLGTVRRAVPKLYERFAAVEAALGSDDEERVMRALYAELPETNFARDVLAARPGNLAVLVADGVIWSDLGRPERALARMRAKAGNERRFDVESLHAATGRAAFTG
jgi:mannose-1-phosphate guanylyltransferase